MRLTKRQLKRIIKEEISKSRRRSIRESFKSNPNMRGQEYFTSDQDINSAADQMVGDIISDYGQEVLQSLANMRMGASELEELAGGWSDSPEAEAVSEAFESMDIDGSGNYPTNEIARALANAIKRAGLRS